LIFAHGRRLPDSQWPVLLTRLENELNQTKARVTLSPETVIAAVDTLGNRLEKGEFDALLARFLPSHITSGAIRPLLSREALETKLAVELASTLFTCTARGQTKARRLPLGVLLHVAPGNQPGLPIYSVLEGLLTGNINLLKLPHNDKGLSIEALSLLVEAAPVLADFIYAFTLSSQESGRLRQLATLSDGVVTWGSDRAVTAIRKLAPPGCKLIEWGHRLSFAYIAGYEDETAECAALAEHIVVTNQRLCSSCQVIFLDTDDFSQVCSFSTRFLPVLEDAATRLRPRVPGSGALSSLAGHTALLERVADGLAKGEKIYRGRGCSVIACPDRELTLSPMEANVLVKALPRREMMSVLRRQRGRLQTAALLCPPEQRAELTDQLARTGVTRITRAGTLSTHFSGEGHDGEYPLARYTRIVDVEI